MRTENAKLKCHNVLLTDILLQMANRTDDGSDRSTRKIPDEFEYWNDFPVDFDASPESPPNRSPSPQDTKETRHERQCDLRTMGLFSKLAYTDLATQLAPVIWKAPRSPPELKLPPGIRENKGRVYRWQQPKPAPKPSKEAIDMKALNDMKANILEQ